MTSKQVITSKTSSWHEKHVMTQKVRHDVKTRHDTQIRHDVKASKTRHDNKQFVMTSKYVMTSKRSSLRQAHVMMSKKFVMTSKTCQNVREQCYATLNLLRTDIQTHRHTASIQQFLKRLAAPVSRHKSSS